MRKILILIFVVVLLILAFAWFGNKRRHSYVADLVVDFNDDVDSSYIDNLGNELSIKFEAESKFSKKDKIYIGHYYSSNNDIINILRKNQNIEAADREMFYSIPENEIPIKSIKNEHASTDGPNDERYHEQWNFKQIHLPEWDEWQKDAGDDVIVAVIDTGVSHVSDLEQTKFVKGYNFVSNTDDSNDDNGHGTHVAGTIAQSTNNNIGVAGIAFKSKIMPLKVLSAEGSGESAGIAEAIIFAADNGAKVINMSLGGPGSSQVIEHAVKYAHDKGVTIVCASGNSSRGKVSFPAANFGAIAVAATQKDETVTSYSNWGKEIAIAAPGGNIRGGDAGGVLQNTIIDGKEDYYYFMGTSMASPHIAAVSAMIIAQGINNPDTVKDILMKTARDPSSMNTKPDDYHLHYGAGIVDADKAIIMAKSLNSKSGHFTYYLSGVVLLLLSLGFLLKKSK